MLSGKAEGKFLDVISSKCQLKLARLSGVWWMIVWKLRGGAYSVDPAVWGVTRAAAVPLVRTGGEILAPVGPLHSNHASSDVHISILPTACRRQME